MLKMDTPVKLPSITAGMNMDMRVHMGLGCLGSHMPVFIHAFMCHVFRVPLRMNVIFLCYPCGVLGLCVLCARVVEHGRFGGSLQQKD